MSKSVLVAAVLVALVAACAKKAPETVYTDPVSTEPVFSGKVSQ